MTSERANGAPGLASVPAAQGTVAWDGPTLFQRTDLTFDDGDKANASLYLCEPFGNPQAGLRDLLVRLLRAGGLWSEQAPKSVRNDQRQDYQDQLAVVEVIALRLDGAPFVLARCDHPRFPSDPQRFDAWKAALVVASGVTGAPGARSET